MSDDNWAWLLLAIVATAWGIGYVIRAWRGGDE